MKLFGFLREPQKMVPRGPRKAILSTFESNIITFNYLIISGVTRVASLKRFDRLNLRNLNPLWIVATCRP